MDPVSQAALGAVTAQAVAQRGLGPRVALIGALAGAAPDIDVLFSVGGDWFDQLVLHRGITHSLFFAPVVGPLLGWLVWRLERARAWLPGAPGAIPADDRRRLLAWMLAVSLALLSHPLLDVLTTYGTQLLQPFSDQRFAVNVMPIIDPLYTGLLCLGSWLAIRSANQRAKRPDSESPAWVLPGGAQTVALIGLVASSGYLALGWQQNRMAESFARAQLTAEGVVDAQVSAFPTLLQIHYRRVVARTPTEDRVGYISTWQPCTIAWGNGPRLDPPGLDAFLASREGRIFHWFTMGWTRFVADTTSAVPGLRAIDLRYGLDSDPDRSLLSVRAPIDPATFAIGPAAPEPSPLADPPVTSGGNDTSAQAATPVSGRLATLLTDTYAPACNLG